MKNFKFLLSAACSLFAFAALAQDFSDPKYAIWGDTPEERQQNILNSNFLKESCDNKNYDAAAHYFKELVDKCPKASENTYVRGITLYKNKINRAKSVDEKNMYVDSLMLVYDLRNQYFGNHAKRGSAYILDRKAREYLTYKPNDRAGIREAFREAIAAGGDNTDPETVVAYFSNLCDDYKNTDEVMPDEILSEYERLEAYFEKHPEASEYKSQFDAAFGMSGAASCENLENLFKPKLEADPENETLLAQAVGLMSRAECSSDFYFNTAERYYQVKPSSETACLRPSGAVSGAEPIPAVRALKKRSVKNPQELKEKILIFEAGLDDAAVELVKNAIVTVVRKNLDGNVHAYFCAATEEELRFALFVKGRQEPVYQTTKMAVYRQSQEVLRTLDYKSPDDFAVVNSKLAQSLLDEYKSI